MTSPAMIQPKFLKTGKELGVVAVGFSGGQVCIRVQFLRFAANNGN